MPDKETLYARWFSGEIDDDELKTLHENGIVQELEKIKEATEQLALPKYDVDSGYEKFKNKYPEKKAKIRSINLAKIMSIAASFLVLVVVAWMILSPGKEQMIMAQNGSNERVDLLDGSTVLINDGSSVQYDTKNWEQERKVNLTGEALFQVEKGSPFIVNSKNGIIRVLGTQFNVRAWSDNLYVECYEGKVEVVVGQQKIILIKNESVNVIKAKMKEKQTIAHQSPRWTSGNSRFYEEDISSVFDELERQYNIKVEAPTIIRSFTGNFAHDNLENAVRNICKPLGIAYSISEDQKTVLIE